MSSAPSSTGPFWLKCPRCGESDLFKDPNPFNLGHLSRCTGNVRIANWKIEPETGIPITEPCDQLCYRSFASLILIGLLILAFHVGHPLGIYCSSGLIVFSPYLFRAGQMVWLFLCEPTPLLPMDKLVMVYNADGGWKMPLWILLHKIFHLLISV